MKNLVQKGDTVTVTAPANFNSGDGVLIGGLFGVAAGDVANGAQLDLAVVGVFDLPKPSGDVFTLGGNVYWDADTKTAHSGGDVDSNSAGTNEALVGVCVLAVGAGVSTVRVRLGQPVALV